MDKVNLKEKTIMVIDSGQFISFAQCLSPSFKKTYYSKPWNINGFPHINDRCIGIGLEGIEVVDDPYKKIDEVDLFIFTDLYNGEFQKHLIKLGKNVFGSRGNETLELDRWEFRKMLIKLGLPRARCELKRGLDKLEAHLKTVKNKYVKISKYRKIHETFKHTNYDLSKPVLDDILHQTGCLRNEVDFIVEDEIKSFIEAGYDGYVIDGQYPQNAIFGIEVKDAVYVCKTLKYSELPKPIQDVNKKMIPYFKDYRMFYSNEMRFTNKTTGFLTDPTCFSDDTDILTDQGWKRFYELDGTEKVCTLNPSNNNIEYHIPTSRISYQFDGELIFISNKSNDLELLVTPNHSVWVKNDRKKRLFPIRADELTGKYYIPRTGIWKGSEPEYFYLPEYHHEWDSGMNYQIHKTKQCDPKPIKIESWLKFLAIYISDGSSRKASNWTVQLAQFDRCDYYEEILRELPFEYTREKSGFLICDVQLATYLQKLGGCNEKYIPDFIKELSPRLINIFLDTYQMADGYLKDGRRTYFTTSYKLADDIQELVLKSGGLAGIFEKQTKGTPMSVASKGGKVYYRNFNSLIISERNKFTDFYLEGWNNKRCSQYLNKVPYSGMVYDVEVENHIIYVRRNGKACWSGNCRNPSPPSEIYQELISNLAEICWFGAQGILVEPIYKAKYAGEVIITSYLLEHGIEQQIEYPKEIENNVKLRYHCKINNRYACISQNMGEVGAIVAIGDSVEDVIKQLKDIASKIQGNDITIRTDKIGCTMDSLEELEKLGITF